MASATTVGNTVKISTPTLSWERVTAPVNEGPAALSHGGRTWIVFSASHCSGTGYKLGRLELTGSDPLNPVFLGANG
jgi:GH43 family beta-xylosidase